jgi:membrane fusion protein, multidrug efflux system
MVIVPMSSTQLSEQAPRAPLPTTEPQLALPEPEKPKGSIIRTVFIVLLVAGVVGAAIWKIRANTEETKAQNTRLTAAGDRPVPVQTQPVQLKTMPIYLTALGSVTAYNTVTIKTRVDGQLLRVNVREGQAVKEGQLLAEIDPAPYAAALAQAQGQLVKDQANSVNAQAEAARYTALLQAGVVSKESQQAQVSTAGQAAGSLDADRAAIEAAKVNLAYTKISSPINGVVGLRQVDPGNIVHAADSTGLLVVTQLQPIAVIFTLPEDQLPTVLKLIRNGTKLTAEAWDRSNTTRLAVGTLLTIDNQIDQTTGTAKLKAVFDNQDGALFPNQFVNIRLILEQMQNAMVVPAAAIQSGTQGNFVYVVKPGDPPNSSGGAAPNSNSKRGGRAKQGTAPASGAGAGDGADAGTGRNQLHYYVAAQTVVEKVTEGSQVILTSGVNPGDLIVVDGQEKLKDGSRVLVPRNNGTGSKTAQEAPAGSTDAGAAAAVGNDATKSNNGNKRQGLDEHLTQKERHP